MWPSVKLMPGRYKSINHIHLSIVILKYLACPSVLLAVSVHNITRPPAHVWPSFRAAVDKYSHLMIHREHTAMKLAEFFGDVFHLLIQAILVIASVVNVSMPFTHVAIKMFLQFWVIRILVTVRKIWSLRRACIRPDEHGDRKTDKHSPQKVVKYHSFSLVFGLYMQNQHGFSPFFSGNFFPHRHSLMGRRRVIPYCCEHQLQNHSSAHPLPPHSPASCEMNHTRQDKKRPSEHVSANPDVYTPPPGRNAQDA